MNTFKINSAWLSRSIDVTLIGAGGTGSAVLTELYQMDYLLCQLSDGAVRLNVTIIDDDMVSTSNVGRQSFWPSDVGLPKAAVLAERFSIHGMAKFKYSVARVGGGDVSYLLSSSDVIITCVDKAAVRAELGKAFEKCNQNKEVLWLDMGNNRNEAQAILGHASVSSSTSMHLPNVYDLYPELDEMVDNDEDSCSHEQALQKQEFGINKRVALEGTGLLWSLLRNGELKHNGVYINMESRNVSPLDISPLSWGLLGYQAP